MDGPIMRFLDGFIEQCENHKFADPEAGMRVDLATIRGVRSYVLDLEERLAEFDNDDTAKRRHFAYLTRRSGEADRMEARLKVAVFALMETACDCAPRAPDYQPQLSVVPGTHDFSCAYRRAMQPVLEAGRQAVG